MSSAVANATFGLTALFLSVSVHADSHGFALGKITGAYVGVVAIHRECARFHSSRMPMLQSYERWIQRNEPLVLAGMQSVIKAGVAYGAELRRLNDEALSRAEQRLAEMVKKDPERTLCEQMARRLESRELEIAALHPNELRQLGISVK